MSVRKVNTVRRGRWPRGMDTVSDIHDLDEQALRSIVDADVTRTGKIRTRPGVTLVSGALMHSGYAPVDWPFALVCANGALAIVEIDPAGAVSTAATTQTLDKFIPVSYCELNTEILYTNTEVSGRVGLDKVVRPWGVPNPAGNPALSETVGGLEPGTYLVSITYMDDEGRESGSSVPAAIALDEAAGIQLTNIPQSLEPHIAYARVYVSTANGDSLYHYDDVPVGTTSYSVMSRQYLGKVLETDCCEMIPPGSIVRSYKGRAYVAKGSTLLYSIPLWYYLYKPVEMHFHFPSTITMVQPVADGIYVGTEHGTFFLVGDDPKTMQQRDVDVHGVVPGTGVSVQSAAFNPAHKVDDAAMWWNSRGVLVQGAAGGEINKLTEDRLALPTYVRGATMYRELRGIKQLISTLQNPGDSSGFVARDFATAEVIRNGVVQ